MDSKSHIAIIGRLFLILFVFSVGGCKAVKNSTVKNDINRTLTTKQIIKEHYKKDHQFKNRYDV